jgi:hypothetical protein
MGDEFHAKEAPILKFGQAPASQYLVQLHLATDSALMLNQRFCYAR